MDEEFDTCVCLSEDLKRIVSNQEALIELLCHCIKKWRVSREGGIWVGGQSDSTIAVDGSGEG